MLLHFIAVRAMSGCSALKLHGALACEQVDAVDGYHAGSLLLRTAQVAVASMKEFQVRPWPIARPLAPTLRVCP